MTLKEIAPKVGSYFTAYSLAAAGKFGPPAAIVGRTQLSPPPAVVDLAVAAYCADWVRIETRSAPDFFETDSMPRLRADSVEAAIRTKVPSRPRCTA